MRLSDVDLRLLRVFCAVVEAGGFAKAQDGLGISQPAISAHIANLEERLNVRLCNRGAQGFSVTDEGQRVLEEAHQLLEIIDVSARKLDQIGRSSGKQIRLGIVDCTVSDPENPTVEVIQRVREGVPDLRIKIGVYDFLDCLSELRGGRLDIALVGIEDGEQLPDDLQVLPLYSEVSGLFCAPDHPCAECANSADLEARLREADIAAYSFLSDPMDVQLGIDLLDQNAGISQANIESIAYLALSGTHVGLMPKHYASRWVETRQLIPLAPERHRAISQFHAVRMKSPASENSNQFWEEFSKA